MPDIVPFVRRWNASTLTERASYQQHFRDLCEALGVPYPTQEEQTDENYTYEKRVAKTGTGESGFADVWRRGWFAWEYKSKGGDLNKAYKQLNEYHEALENPPLLIVCDFVRFEVHTKFENTPPRVYAFTLDDLLHDRDTATCALPPIEVLRHVFGDFNQLRPGITSARVTEAAASDFLRLARELELEKTLDRQRPSKEQIAHFLMRLVFCLFADSVGLLPNHTFRTLIKNDRNSPLSFNRKLPVLFEAMSQEHGFFGAENIPYFNGGLFSDNSTIDLNHADLGILYSASQHDWSHIEPAIFGTLFERSLDAAKRSMIGAHYTSTEDILLLVEPVVMDPLRRSWDSVKSSVLASLAEESTEFSANGAATSQPGAQPQESTSEKDGGLKARSKKISAKATAKRPATPALILNRPALTLLQDWSAELSSVRILDPACGSGNFLYVALKRLLDLWHEARIFAIEHGLTLTLDPMPSPGQLYGIEIDFYAHEIASVVVWIGFLQWKHDHGIKDDREPLLRKLKNIERNDAVLRYGEDGKAYEPTWPEAEYIIGNPPFLGDKKMRSALDTVEHPHYVDDLRSLYEERVSGGADLVIFWFEKARSVIELQTGTRCGLLATQSIRAGKNRETLIRIKNTGDIFLAYRDRSWALDGAAVRISIVGFDAGHESKKLLDGTSVPSINADLTSGTDLSSAIALHENADLAFIGIQKGGPFELDSETARKMCSAPLNVNGRPNSDVIRQWANGNDITGRPKNMYIIDFGAYMNSSEASKYELPFSYILKKVKPLREGLRRSNHALFYWIHAEARPGMRKALQDKNRYIATPRVAKHRLFVWLASETIPDSRLVAIARSDDYFFGTLHSIIHETWTLGTASWHGVGNDPTYNAESVFSSFPFPYPPGTEPSEADSPIVRAIADAARELVRLRDAWLNPPDISEADLKKRTLTNLYNERPTWLANAHRALDEAVFAAYGWTSNLTDQEILSRLLALNHERAERQSS